MIASLLRCAFLCVCARQAAAECANACSGVGTCNLAADATCDCPLGYEGDACEKNVLEACRWRDDSVCGSIKCSHPCMNRNHCLHAPAW
jgi:hypothetical protein